MSTHSTDITRITFCFWYSASISVPYAITAQRIHTQANNHHHRAHMHTLTLNGQSSDGCDVSPQWSHLTAAGCACGLRVSAVRTNARDSAHHSTPHLPVTLLDLRREPGLVAQRAVDERELAKLCDVCVRACVHCETSKITDAHAHAPACACGRSAPRPSARATSLPCVLTREHKV
jgi:hypothetical protein